MDYHIYAFIIIKNDAIYFVLVTRYLMLYIVGKRFNL